MDGSPAGPLLFNASLFSELKSVPHHRREVMALHPHHKSSLDCREIMGLQCFNIGSFSMKMEHEKMTLFFSTFILVGKPHGRR